MLFLLILLSRMFCANSISFVTQIKCQLNLISETLMGFNHNKLCRKRAGKNLLTAYNQFYRNILRNLFSITRHILQLDFFLLNITPYLVHCSGPYGNIQQLRPFNVDSAIWIVIFIGNQFTSSCSFTIKKVLLQAHNTINF